MRKYTFKLIQTILIEIENVYLLYIAINLIYQIHLMYSSKKVLIHLGSLVLEALHLHRETSVLHAQRKENDAKEEHPKVVFIVGNMEDNTEN